MYVLFVVTIAALLFRRDWNTESMLAVITYVCFNVYCDDVTSICDACGEIYASDHVFVRSMSHPTLFYKTENGITAWHCPLCTYYQY